MCSMRHSTKTGARVTCLGEELRVRWVRLQLHGASGSWPFASGQVSSLPADFLSRLSAPSSTRISWEDSAESVWREDMAVRRERRRRRRAAERWLLFVLTLFAVDVVLGERISAAAAAFLTPFKTAGVAGGVHWGSLCQFRGRPPPEELRRVSVWRSGLTGKENTAPLAVAWSDAPFRADLTRRGRGLRLPRALFGGGASRPLPSSQLRGRSAAFSSSQSGGFGNWGGDDFGTEGFAIQVASQVPSATTSPRRPGVLARLTASACYLMPLVDVAQARALWRRGQELKGLSAAAAEGTPFSSLAVWCACRLSALCRLCTACWLV